MVKRKFRQFGEDLLNKKGAFTVPIDYDHDTQIDVFGVRTRKLQSTHYYDKELTSKNFAKTTNRLEPGKTYAIKMFPVLEIVQSEDCLAFLRENNAIFAGAQGLTALQDDQPDVFPTGRYGISFGKKDADGDRWVPSVRRDSDGDWWFRLGYLRNCWGSDYVLVCFCELD